MEQEVQTNSEAVVKDLTEEVHSLANRVKQYQVILTNAEKVYKSLDDEVMKQTYLSEMKPLVKDYENVLLKTKTTLEEYFKWEKTENSPINFSFRKLHKLMTNEYKAFLAIKGF